MPRLLQYTFAGIILGLLVGVPWAYTSWRVNSYRNFHVVREGVLYRSGQLTLPALQRALHDHGIKTVITLRYAPEGKKLPPDYEEEKYCKHIHLNHYRLKHRAWGAESDQSVPAEVNIEQFMRIMSDPENHPVLVHCFAGVHRTGSFCALYRMEFENWTNQQALDEMKSFGYTQDHPDVFSFMKSYQPRGYRVARHEPMQTVLPTSHSIEPPVWIGIGKGSGIQVHGGVGP